MMGGKLATYHIQVESSHHLAQDIHKCVHRTTGFNDIDRIGELSIPRTQCPCGWIDEKSHSVS